MIRFCALLGSVFVAIAFPAIAKSHVYQYAAILSGASESTPNLSLGAGTAVAVLDLDLHKLSLDASFSGLTGTVTSANVYALTVSPLAGTAIAAMAEPTLPDFPLNVTSGNYQKTVSLADEATYNPNFIAANGTFVSTALNALYTGLEGGQAYFNIKTTAYPDGEIRGFLVRILGDFNHNLVVDAADYTVWRNSLGQVGETLPADTDHNAFIDRQDYLAWRDNYGQTVSDLFPGTGSGASIPEPTALAIMSAGIGMLLIASRRLRHGQRAG